MLYVIVFLYLVILLFQKRRNNCYLLLVLLQIASIGMGGFVGHYLRYDTLKTFLNLLFVLINIYLIISPWRYASFQEIIIKDKYTFLKIEKLLDYTLRIVLVVNTIVFLLVLIFIPDIAEFKNEQGFKQLYDSIPMFSTIFRICAMTQYLGYFAIPISAYYLQEGNKKKSLKFLFLSLSSLMGAVALYSRAGILTFFLTAVAFYLLVFSIFNTGLRDKIKKVIIRGTIAVVALFLTITVIRFSAMPWYGDRIPSDSKIQDPIAYNIFDYASQGFTNGISQLELHTKTDVLKGEANLYLVYQTLSFFHLMNWSSDEAHERFDKAYNKNGLEDENDSSAFHGYTCRLIKDFGYIITLIIDVIFFCYIKNNTKRKRVDIKSLFIIVLLLTQPCVSIFYETYGEILFPYLFLIIITTWARMSKSGRIAK